MIESYKYNVKLRKGTRDEKDTGNTFDHAASDGKEPTRTQGRTD